MEDEIYFILNRFRQEIDRQLDAVDETQLEKKLIRKLTEKDRRLLIRRLKQLETNPDRIRLTEPKDLILLLLYLRGKTGKRCEPILGITRITKLLFLAFQELILPDLFKTTYRFVPYKLGPFTPQIYADIETLSDLGLITARPLDPEGFPIIALDWNAINLIAALNSGITAAERLDAVNLAFSLTPKGKQLARALANSATRKQKNLIPGLEIIKTQFGALPLTHLLRYVYTRYPEYTTRSRIIEKLFPPSHGDR